MICTATSVLPVPGGPTTYKMKTECVKNMSQFTPLATNNQLGKLKCFGLGRKKKFAKKHLSFEGNTSTLEAKLQALSVNNGKGIS